MRKRFFFPINEHVYEKVTGTIRDMLTSKEKDRKCITRIVLAAEDVLKKLLDNQAEGAKNVTLLIVRFMGSIRVTLSCPDRSLSCSQTAISAGMTWKWRMNWERNPGKHSGRF